jgi:hypothetical protein
MMSYPVLIRPLPEEMGAAHAAPSPALPVKQPAYSVFYAKGIKLCEQR